MSALYRMAFNTHKQVEITSGDRVIISASAIPGNEKAVSKIINELYRKGADVVYEKSEGLHVSGHACQEELKIVHGLVKPKFFLPVHGEQRHLQIHSKLAQHMGMNPRNIFIGEIGSVFELSGRTCKLKGSVPAGKVFVDGSGVGDVGSVVLRDRKHLAEDGMIVVCVNLSAEDGSVVTGPDIITRGFVYVKESEELMDALQTVAQEALERCQRKHIREEGRDIGNRSFLYGTMEDAQQLVDRYSGTGEPKLDGNGNWTHKEFVTADHLVGESVNPETGIATPTHRFAIHYGKRGTHVVPMEERKT